MRTLRDGVAVITGAGSGFGLEFARKAAAEGMRLVLADVQADALEAARLELEASGAELLARRTDVSDGAQVAALAEAAVARFGRVHLLFNNAGVGAGGLLWENSEADWAWTLGVNLWGVIHGVRAFVPRMLAWAGEDADYEAHVVNTASMAGLVNPPLSGVYNVSKHAVVSLSETLHHDLALVTSQVRCSVLCPYYVPTGIARSARNRPPDMATSAATRSQQVAGELVARAVEGGRVTAPAVADLVFAAVREGRFYVASHPHALEGVRQRAEAIVCLEAPDDPFAARPGMRETLAQALRG